MSGSFKVKFDKIWRSSHEEEHQKNVKLTKLKKDLSFFCGQFLCFCTKCCDRMSFNTVLHEFYLPIQKSLKKMVNILEYVH